MQSKEGIPIIREKERLSETARRKAKALKRIWRTVLRVKAMLVTNTTTNMYMQNILLIKAMTSPTCVTRLNDEVVKRMDLLI